MAGVDEQHRQRIAGLLLLLGGALILLGTGLLIYQQAQLEASQPLPKAAVEAKSPEVKLRQAQTIHRVLYLVLILVVVFSVATLAFLRWSRHFRRRLKHRPAMATPAEDVWAMHRLPADYEEDPNAPREPGTDNR